MGATTSIIMAMKKGEHTNNNTNLNNNGKIKYKKGINSNKYKQYQSKNKQNHFIITVPNNNLSKHTIRKNREKCKKANKVGKQIATSKRRSRAASPRRESEAREHTRGSAAPRDVSVATEGRALWGGGGRARRVG